MDRGRHRIVGGGGNRGRYGRDEVGAFVVAGLGQVDLVARPTRRPLLRLALREPIVPRPGGRIAWPTPASCGRESTWARPRPPRSERGGVSL